MTTTAHSTPDTGTSDDSEAVVCCVRRIDKSLRKVDGVDDAQVDLATEVATVTSDPAVGLGEPIGAVRAAGYGATPRQGVWVHCSGVDRLPSGRRAAVTVGVLDTGSRPALDRMPAEAFEADGWPAHRGGTDG